MAKLFEALQNPLPGTDWYVRELTHYSPPDTDEWIWDLQLMRRTDGEAVRFEHAELAVVWHRAVEKAHAIQIRLFEDS